MHKYIKYKFINNFANIITLINFLFILFIINIMYISNYIVHRKDVHIMK